MSISSVAAAGMAAATRQLESVASNTAKAAVTGEGDPVGDTVTLSEAARAFSANVAVLKVDQELTKTLARLGR